MQRVFKGGALVALIAILIAPTVYADDLVGPFDPPAVRGIPPIGIAGQDAPPQVRMIPPGGVAGQDDPPQVRMIPPIGVAAQEEPPTIFELFWAWLQMRIGPPIG